MAGLRARAPSPTLMVLLAVLLPPCSLLIAQGIASEPKTLTARELVVIQTGSGSHRFLVEVASTPSERTRGLMHRETLAEDGGMLFLYPQPQQARMWMKDTPLSLDMLFLDEDGKIVKIVEETTPYSTAVIRSGAAVRGVLELPGGTSIRLRLQTGDRVLHPALEGRRIDPSHRSEPPAGPGAPT